VAGWACLQCGSENAVAERRCAVCRHPNLPRGVVLISLATGREAEITEPLRFGRAVFTHRFGDPDAQYASELQFELVRDETQVAWVIRPLPGAVNSTCYNGRAVGPEGCPIEDGGIISIGKARMQLKVRLKPGKTL
jgi:hypothetical protein